MLSDEDRDLLLLAMSNTYDREAGAHRLLGRIGYPRARMVGFSGIQPEEAWSDIFRELERGIVPNAPFRRLLGLAFREYGGNDDFRHLMRLYVLNGSGGAAAGAVPATSTQHTVEPAGASREIATRDGDQNAAGESDADREHAYTVSDVAHVIIGVNSEDEARAAFTVLTDLELHPVEEWFTIRAISFRVATADTSLLRTRLAPTGLNWTVVPPGEPDYIYRSLIMQGPDGRRFQFTDTPSNQTVEDLASQVHGAYPASSASQTVVDLVQPDGSGRRLDANRTLHRSGVRDGDRFRMAFRARAGAVNPLDRQDALYRVHGQMTEFRDANPGFEFTCEPSLLPTEYVLRFEQPSFGPPEHVGSPPPGVVEHVVDIELGLDFPESAPHVFWRSPIFHPNVKPNYEDDWARANPYSRGAVCLGMLQESYLPSLHFGDLCRMLIDMAGFRNYSVLEDSGLINEAGKPILRGNFYNEDAARWVIQPTSQLLIKAIGGELLADRRSLGWSPSGPGGGHRFRAAIEEVDQ